MGSDLWCNSSDAIVRGIVPLDSSKLGWKRVLSNRRELMAAKIRKYYEAL